MEVNTMTAMNAMTAALRMRLESLPPLNLSSPSRSLHQRKSSDLSSASSAFSEHSFSSSHHSDETEATDFTQTPFRSRSSTLWKPEPQPTTMAPVSEFIPSKPPIRIILGTASVGSSLSPFGKITDVDSVSAYLATFRSRGYLDIDTARAYPVGRAGTCEKLLGDEKVRLGTWANVSTKVSSFKRGAHKAASLEESINASLTALNADSVDIMYLHAPDKTTSFTETCEAMNKAYFEGKFERFGLSNYSVAQVEEIVDICDKNGWIRPSVYQGQYNPICRGAEKELFTVLRKHNISFYAYSPSACGFFSNKTTRQSTIDRESRWNIASPLGAKYASDYFHDPLFAAAAMVKLHAERYGISGHAAALRWTAWHSQLAAEEGDAVIVGSSSLAQLEENLNILEQGPLPEPLLDVLSAVWEDVKGLDKGPRFSFV